MQVPVLSIVLCGLAWKGLRKKEIKRHVVTNAVCLAVPVGGSCAKAHTQVVLLNLQVSPAREGALFPISEEA